MKSIQVSSLFVSLVAAHSAVWDITFDGTQYPARDARFDAQLGAKRIEWTFDNELGRPWQAINDVQNNSIACKFLSDARALNVETDENQAVPMRSHQRSRLGPELVLRLSYIGPE